MILNTAALPVAPGRVATWPLGPEHFDVAARWLADERNAEWLDFGSASGVLSPVSLRILSQRSQHCVWIYGPAEGEPAGPHQSEVCQQGQRDAGHVPGLRGDGVPL